MSEHHGLAAVLSELTAEVADTPDVLQHLMAAVAGEVGASATAVLALDDSGALNLLGASSHRVEHLEVLQVQQEEGPCVDVIRLNTTVRASGADLRGRWPVVGEAIERAGFGAVESYPVRWRGRPFAGLNLFYLAPPVEEHDATKQAYADLVSLAVISGPRLGDGDLLAQLRATLVSRELIEMAKGVLAEQRGVSMAEAHEILLEAAERSGRGLTATAEDVVGHRGVSQD